MRPFISPWSRPVRNAAIVLLVGAVSLLALAGCGRHEPVQLRFTLSGTEDVRRIQFYVSDVELLRNDGKVATPFAITPDGHWQHERVALVDLAGGSERRDVVAGRARAGVYTGVRFSIGVPFDLNHANPLTAPAPLNRAELFWTWQSGYKFLRVELTDDQHAGAFHLGSTGCSSASALRPPQQPCGQPNVMRVELRGFDPLREPIELRTARLVSALNMSTRPACTGDYKSDVACIAAYSLTGLDVNAGECRVAGGICTPQELFATP